MRLAKLLRRFRRDASAAVTVEFAMILPVMLTFLLASVEAPGLLWARADVASAVGTLGDLAAQSSAIDEASAATIFRAADGVLDGDGGETGDFSGRLTAALVCRCTPGADSGRWCFSVLWSHTYANGALGDGWAMDVDLPDMPQRLGLAENDTIIIAEAALVYAPQLDFALQGGVLTLNEITYLRPRRTREVTHVGGQARSSPKLCPVS